MCHSKKRHNRRRPRGQVYILHKMYDVDLTPDVLSDVLLCNVVLERK
jgi:hypothetical protein